MGHQGENLDLHFRFLSDFKPSTECYSGVPPDSGDRYLDWTILRAALRRAVRGKHLFQLD
jgi:hypothetical protein